MVDGLLRVNLFMCVDKNGMSKRRRERNRERNRERERDVVYECL